MTLLERLYASSGSEVIHDTLQIAAGDQNYWLTSGWDNVSVTLENGQTATFEGCAIDIALPARNADGTQDLKFAISNIDGEVSGAIDKLLDEMKSATLTFRRYISTDLSAPAAAPYTLDVKSGSWTQTSVQVTAGYMNILKTAWPRNRYNLAEHPGLRY
ncbi:DUF1833 family protein [Klebsiella pneumoniae]|jgi:hypothetical protein|uniref:DUF1833 family protein n=1 Tax=Klebsiella/Raoultella group TaxID=2890311 RepID=UPI0015E97E9D|nr:MULTISPECIES: DUF1833 family protein [Klebsiella/Raoultella group]EGT0068940.1 DUF1833 domain-containing protein [Klebsiella michiganensis]QLU25249.1 DUF1833 family protein [Klebsiella oxytoca]MCZ0885547.1 DUF1833 family protein [Raoultella ornithinolytica]WDI68051.1 DUF1833 family protein [Klebsiella grimontii]HDT6584374.1 DUF1833 family protein [Raoultella ornithinolytica]